MSATFFFDRAGLFAVDARATLQKAQASNGVSYNELCLGGKLLSVVRLGGTG